jgi:hypothetical protein
MAKTKAGAKRRESNYYQGTVDGIDVHAYGGQPVRCFAIINQGPKESIQVIAYRIELQAALQLASAKRCPVEVEFEDDGSTKNLLRVRLLDR